MYHYYYLHAIVLLQFMFILHHRIDMTCFLCSLRERDNCTIKKKFALNEYAYECQMRLYS